MVECGLCDKYHYQYQGKGDKMDYEQTEIKELKRLSVDINATTHRLAKSKAALQNRSLTDVVETLLVAWLNGATINKTNEKGKK